MYCHKHNREYVHMCSDCMVENCSSYNDTPIAMPNVDVVNKPQHYQGKVECIDAIESAVQGLEGMEAMCTGNAIKYLYRWKKKGGRVDLEKSKWYIERLLNGLDAR